MDDILDIEFVDVEKYNPYHGPDGRFTTAGAATLYTYRTKNPLMQGTADKANEREKKRTAAPGADFGLTADQHSKLEEYVNTSRFKGDSPKADEYRKELGMSDDDFKKYIDKYRTKEKQLEVHQNADKKRRQEEAEKKKQLDERVKEELPGIRQENISAANNVSFFEHGSVAAREALGRLDDYRNRNKIDDNWTDEQKAYAKQREEEYKQLLTEYYNDSLRRYADDPSWAVTGPANYNVRRHEKKMNAAMNKANEYEEKLKRFEENTNKKLKSMTPDDDQIAYWRQGKWKNGETIDAADPLATKKLQAKLDYLNESQTNMKAANAYYKKNGTMEGFSGFSDATNKQIDAALKSGNSWQKKPFESYSLTNNNAQIKATQQRLKDIESQKARAASGGGSSSFNGGKLVRNAEANRLQLIFDEKPSAEMRAKLKSNGFKWAPSQGAWQRQLTDNAERAAERILGEDMQKMYRPAQTFNEVRSERIQKNAYDEWLEEHMDASEDEQKRMKKKLEKEKDSDSDEFTIMKSDDDKREVFGWALVAIRKDGEQIVDHQKDVVDPDELEHAAYEYVLNFRDTGELHDADLRKKGRLIESVVLTKEKQAAMGIPAGTVPEGWWVGFKIEDDAAWQGIKSGRYKMFSIEGQGIRQPMDD